MSTTTSYYHRRRPKSINFPKIWGMSQKVDINKTAHRRHAENKYPDLSPDDALREIIIAEHIEGIFFPNDDGDRWVWGEDLKYYQGMGYENMKFSCVEVSDNRARKFLVLKGYAHRLKEIDARTHPRKTIALLKHTSEDGWNRPVDHDYHITKLPTEIQELILSFVLTSPASPLSPIVISSNWKRVWRKPGLSDLETQVVSVPRRDKDGKFEELHSVTRPVIDSCVLRTSKYFLKLGTRQLYGNTFDFSTTEYSQEACPPLMIRNRKTQFTGLTRFRGNPKKDLPDTERKPSDKGVIITYETEVIRPEPRKPESSDDELEEKIALGMSQMEKSVHFTKLLGWVYYDSLLRFIHSIGLERASIIKSLQLSGTVFLHVCHHRQPSCAKQCARLGEDLLHSLRIYLPFMVKYLTNLESLTLYADRDEHGRKPYLNEDQTLIDPHVEALRSFVSDDLRQVASLVNLKVLDGREELDALKEDTEWFVQRHRENLKTGHREV